MANDDETAATTAPTTAKEAEAEATAEQPAEPRRSPWQPWERVAGVTCSTREVGQETLVEVSVPSGDRVQVALFGATLVSWTSAGEERLWTSTLSPRDGSGPIRGGVPVCFPQFAAEGPLRMHGFARELTWRLARCEAGVSKDAAARVFARAVFEVSSQDLLHVGAEDGAPSSAAAALATEYREYYLSRPFALSYVVTVGPATLDLALSVENTGDANLPFTGCLHSYFRVPDSRNVRVEGLQRLTYWDKVANKMDVEVDDAVTVEAAARHSGAALANPDEDGFLDRVYVGAGHAQRAVTLRCGPGSDALVLRQWGFPDTVLFNPWKNGKRGPDKGPDFDDDGYEHMICIEPAVSQSACAGPVQILPGRVWTGRQLVLVRAGEGATVSRAAAPGEGGRQFGRADYTSLDTGGPKLWADVKTYGPADRGSA